MQTELERVTQESYVATDRVVERRKEVLRELDQLTRKPERDWSKQEKVAIKRNITRLMILLG